MINCEHNPDYKDMKKILELWKEYVEKDHIID